MKNLAVLSGFRSVIAPFLYSILVVGCSAGHMQSRSESVSNGSVRVDQQLDNESVVSTNSEYYKGGVTTPETPTLHRCISILSEIPNDLREVYEARLKKDEQLKRSIDEKIEMEPGIEIFAFTFSSGTSDVSSERSRCDVPIEPKSNIQFVTVDVNKILALYIRAIVNNSSEISKTKRNLELKPNNKALIELCQDIRCAFREASSKKSFDIENEADLIYAGSFTDTMLGVNTSNDIRRLHSNSDPDFYFTDSEIGELLRLSYDLAITQLSVEVR